MKVWLAIPLVALVAHAAPARMQVSAKEFSYTLSRTHLHPGPATIELVNFGQDPHDLRVQRVGARHIAGVAAVAPGGHADLTVTLRPGRYLFWCSLANHRQLGMRGTLVVR
ncbi:MAG TPA: cupredoxin domain-containing protein [Gaiellaceae bacterium]|nr:cupredoxin domain-containing protein [Gaiellaceae bacterium]